MRNKLLISVVFLFSFSCKQKEIYNSCLNDNFKKSYKYDFENKNFNYLDSIGIIETKMRNDEILNSIDKKGYLNYIESMGETKKKKKDLERIKSFSYFFEYINTSQITFSLLAQCCECDNPSYGKRDNIYYDMKQDSGHPSIKNLKKLVDITDFGNKYERWILLNFIYIHLKAYIDDNIIERLHSSI